MTELEMKGKGAGRVEETGEDGGEDTMKKEHSGERGRGVGEWEGRSRRRIGGAGSKKGGNWMRKGRGRGERQGVERKRKRRGRKELVKEEVVVTKVLNSK